MPFTLPFLIPDLHPIIQIILAGLALLASFCWKTIVGAGGLLWAGQTDRVGQRGLLGMAAWATGVGATADAAYTLFLLHLMAQRDPLLETDPLRPCLIALLIPLSLSFFGNIFILMRRFKMTPTAASRVAICLAGLTLPWLLLVIEPMGQAIPGTIIAALVLGHLLLAVAPWLIYAADAWVESAWSPATGYRRVGRRQTHLARTAVSLLILVALVALAGVSGTLARLTPGNSIVGSEPLPGQLIFSSRGRTYLISGDGTERHILRPEELTLHGFTPDGRRVLITDSAGEGEINLALVDVQTGQKTALGASLDGRVAWSPDGQTALVTRRRTDGGTAIWSLPLAGGDGRVLSEGSSPTWSPDGQRIAFVSRRSGRSEIWVIRPDGTDPIQLTREGGESPAWSPTGETVAFIHNGRVYLVNADGSGRRALSSDDEPGNTIPVLSWSPDGRWLLYAHLAPGGEPNPRVVLLTGVTLETPVAATPGSVGRWRLRGDYYWPVVWSPDGRFLAFHRAGAIWLLRPPPAAYDPRPALSQSRAADETRLVTARSFVWIGPRPAVTVHPVPTYPPTPTPTPLPPAVVESPHVLLVDPLRTTTVYAGTQAGVLRRDGSSGGWVRASTGIALPNRVRTLVFDARSSLLWAGTDGERGVQGGAIYRSSDRGEHWEAGQLRGVDIYTLLLDPTQPRTIWAATSKGIYRTLDGGDSWQVCNAGLKSAQAQALALGQGKAPKGEPAPRLIYAGDRSGGLYVSNDNGNHWQQATTVDGAVNAIVTLPDQPGVALAATTDGLYRTSDNGVTWVPVAGGIWKARLDGIVLDPTQPKQLYAFGLSGVFKSRDGGENWGPVGPGYEGSQATAVVVDPTDSDIVYLGTDRGVFRSGNGGITWVKF